MHLLVLGEGYEDGLKNFEKYFDSKTYKSHKTAPAKEGRVRIREAKLYTISLNEGIENEFLADLKSFIREQNDSKNQFWDKVIRLVKRFKIFFGGELKDVDMGIIESSNLKQKLAEKGTHINAQFNIIGKVSDAYRDGEERV